jgi:MoaA/NifB/PqqE/SkfB family radical SAM enzyme
VPRFAPQLKSLSVLKLSFDGPARVHDRLRGEGAYERLMKAVEAAKKEGINAAFNCTLTNFNLEHLESLVGTSQRLGVPIKFSPVNQVHAGSKDLKDLMPRLSMYKKGLDYLSREARLNRYILNSASNLRYISFFPEGPVFPDCIAGKIFCHIKPDGGVYPCEKKCSGGALNCRKEGIGKAFYSLEQPGCNECWCTGTLELNMIYSLKLPAILRAWAGDF